jgi:ABC-type molybdenum transport system ATPase subunit/photorepair protein PhrA
MNAERGNHPGILILDEPRQQETDKVSVAALIQRLARSSANGLQVVFATSEDPIDLDRFLAGLPHTRLLSDGSRLLS